MDNPSVDYPSGHKTAALRAHVVDGLLVAICSIDDIIENAKIFEVSINEEFKRVLIHGVLHLIGFEDKNKILKDKMTKLENKGL